MGGGDGSSLVGSHKARCRWRQITATIGFPGVGMRVVLVVWQRFHPVGLNQGCCVCVCVYVIAISS